MKAIVEAVVAAAVRVGAAVYRAWFGPPTDAPNERRQRALDRRAVSTIWRLRRAYEAAADDGNAITALQELRQILPSPDETRRAVEAWTLLIETVVQEAERRYGSRPGQGAYKAALVKSAIVRLLIDQKLPVADLPTFLHPVVIDTLVDIWIDSLVVVFNQHELWEGTSAAGEGVGLLARVVSYVRRLWQAFWKLPPVVVFANWLRAIVRRIVLSQHPLVPAVERALEQVRRDGLLDLDDGARRFRELLLWVQRHRRLLVALVELASIATTEAEAFERMSGPEKKAYARALVHAFLKEYDLAPPEGTIAAVVADYVIDWSIDNLVVVFHRRGVFKHRRHRAA
jgi:hypothetical protein